MRSFDFMTQGIGAPFRCGGSDSILGQTTRIISDIFTVLTGITMLQPK